MLDNLDNYATGKLSRVNVPVQFRPHIKVDYPKNNKLIFEEWLFDNFSGCNSDRVYLPVFWTSYFVNYGYAQDMQKVAELQNYIDSLDRDFKYWTCVQYDDCCVVDFKDLDIFVFGMAKRLEEQKIDYLIPLMGQKNSYTFSGAKEYSVSFIGSITHPIRKRLIDNFSYPNSYISTKEHDAYSYCEIISKSHFVLCPRGYAATSFRITESLEFGAIPIFISDKFLVPHNLDFNEYGLMVHEDDIDSLPQILNSTDIYWVVGKRRTGERIYNEYYTYESNLNLIKEQLLILK